MMRYLIRFCNVVSLAFVSVVALCGVVLALCMPYAFYKTDGLIGLGSVLLSWCIIISLMSAKG